MQSFTRLTLVLCWAWAATLLYGEMAAYWLARRSCSWPHLHTPFPSSPPSDHYVKVAVIADTQLMDRTSLGLASKSFALEAAEFYTDLYMRRSFQSSILPLQPDLLVFLGDQFDRGLYLSDEEWKASLTRFKHIFSLRADRDSSTPTYYLSGNHDIGYSGVYSHHPEVISRYEQSFGARNYIFSSGKVDFVVVDAQTLDDPNQGKEWTTSWEFIRMVANATSPNPRVLLTHIPLYRHDNTYCGPYRNSPVINQRVHYASSGRGIIYQNYLAKQTTNHLLDLIKPILVLSGHDHDQCTVVHKSSFGSVTEHTLGTLSWQQGNLYPSFMLLSAARQHLANGNKSDGVILTKLCFLPKQTHIYIWYLCQFVVSLLLLIFWPTNGLSSLRHVRQLGTFIRSLVDELTTRTKEKDDDDCEYEMVWDAEGSMHLVKKQVAKAPAPVSDTKAVGRGNAVARSAAKKQQQDSGPSVFVEMTPENSMGGGAGRLHHLGRSKMRKLIRGLFRVTRALLTIAAINVPIYMILLFKDWVEL